MVSMQTSRKKAPMVPDSSKGINGFNKKAMGDFIIEELSKKFEAISLSNMGRHVD